MALLRLVPAFGTPITVTKETSIVGREPGCDVYVNDGSVSRRHAHIELRRGAWFVVDQRSANGTFLDGQRISDALLRPGQEVRFGTVAFRVEIQEGVEGTVLSPQGYPPGPLAPARPGHPAPPPAWPAAPPAPPRVGPPYVVPSAPPPAPPIAYRPTAPGAPPPVAAPPPPHRVGPPYVVPPPPPPPRPPGLPPPRPAGHTPSEVPSADGPPAKEGRGPLLWIALGCGGALLLAAVVIVLAIGGVIGLPFLLTRAPVHAAEAHLALIKSGDLATAHAGLSEGYKAQVSRETFEAFVARHPALKDNASVGFTSWAVHNDTADLAGRLATASGTREEMSIHLVKEGGVWRVAGLEVSGDRLEAKPASAGPGLMKVETGEVQKRRDGNVIKVAIKINVSGFQVRPDGDRFTIDLAEDVETTGPSGERIDALSRSDVQRFRGSTSFEQGAVASLSTPLILDPGSSPGDYRVRVTVRDLVGGGQASHEVAFQVP